MAIKLTQSYVQSLKPDGKAHWIRDGVENKLLLYLGKSGKKTWYVDYTRQDGKRDHYKIGPAPDIITVTIARDKAREFLARITLGEDAAPKPMPNIKLRELIDDHYAPWVKDNRRSSAGTLAMLRNAFTDFLEQPVAAITPLQIEQWRAKYRREQNARASTINRYITTLKAALNWGIKHEIIEPVPITRLEKLREDDSDTKIRYLSTEERERLFVAMDARDERIRIGRDSHNEWLNARDKEQLPDLKDVTFVDYLKPMVIVSLNTGIRRGSLFGLLWSDIDFQEDILTVRPPTEKNSKLIHIPMNSILTTTLRAWKAQTGGGGDELVFVSPKTGIAMDNCRKAVTTQAL